MQDLNEILSKMKETENRNNITSMLELEKLPKEEKNRRKQCQGLGRKSKRNK